MHWELFPPGVLACGARPASLELLAARGRRSRTPPQRLERWLQQAFGLEGPEPSGALSLLGPGVAPGHAICAGAEPAQRKGTPDRVVLAPAAALPLDRG